MKRRAGLVAALVLAAALGACGEGDQTGDQSDDQTIEQSYDGDVWSFEAEDGNRIEVYKLELPDGCTAYWAEDPKAEEGGLSVHCPESEPVTGYDSLDSTSE